MKLLRNTINANEYYDLKSKIFHVFDSLPEIIGWYKLINDAIFAIYVDECKLFIFYNDAKYIITNTFVVKVEQLEDDTKKLLLYDNENLIFELLYSVEVNYTKGTSFDYLDDEDFDWGLFISNIINNQERKTNFIKNLSS